MWLRSLCLLVSWKCARISISFHLEFDNWNRFHPLTWFAWTRCNSLLGPMNLVVVQFSEFLPSYSFDHMWSEFLKENCGNPWPSILLPFADGNFYFIFERMLVPLERLELNLIGARWEPHLWECAFLKSVLLHSWQCFKIPAFAFKFRGFVVVESEEFLEWEDVFLHLVGRSNLKGSILILRFSFKMDSVLWDICCSCSIYIFLPLSILLFFLSNSDFVVFCSNFGSFFIEDLEVIVIQVSKFSHFFLFSFHSSKSSLWGMITSFSTIIFIRPFVHSSLPCCSVLEILFSLPNFYF